jgi:hypothetical protein
MSRFKGLDNKELTYIFLYFKEKLDDYDSIISQKGIGHSFNGPMGEINFFQSLDEYKLDTIRTSEKVLYLRGIIEKLGPIIELIYDADPDLVDGIKTSLHTPLITKFDDSEEEDM